MRKENILLSILFVLAIMSFTLPFLATNIQNSILQENEKSIEISSYKLEAKQEYTINDTDDLSIIYEIITFGTQSLQNIIGYSEALPSEVYKLVNEEITLLQNEYILPKIQFILLDTPTIFMYTSTKNGSILIWEYYFCDEQGNILKLLFHSNSSKIISLDYENELINNNEWNTVDQYSPYITEPYSFNYTDKILNEVLIAPPKILKTQIRLFNSGFTTTVHKKID